MKKIIFLLITVLVLGITACNGVVNPNSEQTMGTISILIPPIAPWVTSYQDKTEQTIGGRALLYATMAVVRVSKGGTVVVGPTEVTPTVESGASVQNLVTLSEIPMGSDYTVEVDLFNSVESTQVLLQGSKTGVTVESGATSNVMVTLFPLSYEELNLSSIRQDLSSSASNPGTLNLNGEKWYKIETGSDISYEVSLESAEGHSAYIFDADGVILEDLGYVIVDSNNPYTLSGLGTYYIGIAGTGANSETVTLNITPSLEAAVYYAGTNNGTLTLPLGESVRDVYLIFTNPSGSDVAGTTTISEPIQNPQASVKFDKAVTPARSTSGMSSLSDSPISQRGKPEITRFNQDAHQSLTRGSQPLSRNMVVPEPSFATVGTSTFNYIGSGDTPNTYTMTLRAQSLNIATAKGEKTVRVWVDADSWVDGGTKVNLVTQEMVDALLGKFITTGENNDIYDWVTTIFGEEYGNHPYNNLINPSDTIDILLFDIDDDNSTNGGVVGYYWARDQFLQSSETASSERVLFALDSVLTATPEGQNPWSENARWFQEVISTLAHEFQHMINFYQRTVIMEQNDEAWYNEMFSMVAEDLVANKILVNGPRGVDYATADAGVVENQFGRLPYFIFYPDRSLTFWANDNDVLFDYAASYAFGAFLTRFTGEPGFFYDLYQRNATGLPAVRAQIQVAEGLDSLPSTTEVLARWGAAVLLSDTTTAVEPGNYNTGGFFSSSINGSSYSVGSINIFNYRYFNGEITQDGPIVYSGGTANPYGGFEPTSNTYYEFGTGLTGTQKVTISGMPAGVSVTVVLK